MKCCPEVEAVVAWFAEPESFDLDSSRRFERHLESCTHCQQALDECLEDNETRDWRRLLNEASKGCGDSAKPGDDEITRTDAPPVEDSVVVLAGELDQYCIVRELGRGAMGMVLLAEDRILRRRVALKVPRSELVEQPEFRQRFVNEARAAAGLEHPHAVRCYQVANRSQAPWTYMVMEFVDGESLSERLRRDNVLSPRTAAQIALQTAEALQAAHRLGIVHRDVKTSNLLLDRDSGHVKLSDFGLARFDDASQKLTQTGGVVGTVAYMSPEHIADARTVEPRSDLFSLGIVLYEMLTGLRPFLGGTIPAVMQQIAYVDPPAPRRLQGAVPRDLEVICLKCLEKEPRRRYESAGALADDLRRFLAGEPIRARPCSAYERAWRYAKRRPARASAFALTALLLVVVPIGSVLVAWQWQRAERALEETETNLYIHRIALADRDWQANRAWSAYDLLQLCREDQRGFEWHLLMNRCTRGLWSLGPRPALHCGIALSPNGRRLALVEGRVLRILAVPGQQLVSELNDPTKPLGCAVFSPDSSRIATVGEDWVRIWNVATGDKLQDWRIPFQILCQPAFSPDGTLLALAGTPSASISTSTIKVWSIADGREILSVASTGNDAKPDRKDDQQAQHLVDALAFTPDGKFLCAAVSDNAARIWRISTKKLEQTLRHDLPCNAVAYSGDGAQLAVATRKRDQRRTDPCSITIWDTLNWTKRPQFDGHSENINSVAFTPDNRYLVSSSNDATVRQWNLTTGKHEILSREFGGIINLSLSADAQWMATYCGIPMTPSAAVRVLRKDDPQIVRDVGRGNYFVTSVAFSPDGACIATASGDRTARVWDAKSGQPLYTLAGHEGTVSSVAFSPDGTRLVTACFDDGPSRKAGTLRIWQASHEQPLACLTGHSGRVHAAVLSPDGRYIASGGTDGIVRIWDSSTGALVRNLSGHSEEINHIAYSPDGRWLASASKDGSIQLWDPRTGKVAWSKTTMDEQPITCVAFCQDGKYLAIGDARGAIHLLTPATDNKFVPLHGHDKKVTSVAFAPNSRRLASTSDDGTVRLWDVETARELLTLYDHRAGTTAAAFSPDGNRLATVGWDGKLRIWDGTPRPTPPRLPGEMTSTKAADNSIGTRKQAR